MPNSTHQGDIREFLRINFPHARVVSPTPEQTRRNEERRRRNESRNVGVRTSDPPESLSMTVTQLVAKIQSLECRLSGALDQINIMKETFKKEMEDQERRVKADAEERIKKAEEDVDNLRRMLETNSNQSGVEQHTVGVVGTQHPSPEESNATVDDGEVRNVVPLPPGVTPEVLTSMARDWRRLDENYWRRSIMISGIGSPGDSDSYRAVRERLRAVGLAYLVEDCVSNYITGRGSIRLSYQMEHDAKRYIIRARKTLKESGNRQVHVEYLVPSRMVASKKKLMQFGRRQKADGAISSYDVMVKNNEPVLRTFKHGTGVVYINIDQIEQPQQDNIQMEII